MQQVSINGVGGQLTLTPKRVIIKRQGMLAKAGHGYKGDKEIPMKNITAIQFKPSGSLTNGYIQFSILGGNEAKGGVFDATSDENTVMFKKSQEAAFREVKRFIDAFIDEEPIPLEDLRISPKKRKSRIWLWVFGFIAVLYFFGRDDETTTNDSTTNVQTTQNQPKQKIKKSGPKVQSKILAFNNPSKVIKELSKTDLSGFTSWKATDGKTYRSISNYFEFGDGANPNNLAAYLSSPNKNRIENLRLVLNINQPDRENDAIREFARMSYRIADKIDIDIPSDAFEKFKKEGEVSIPADDYSLRIYDEKGKIRTIKMEITSKRDR